MEKLKGTLFFGGRVYATLSQNVYVHTFSILVKLCDTYNTKKLIEFIQTSDLKTFLNTKNHPLTAP